MKKMTVKDLKQKLIDIPDDAILCCQSDSEGNEESVCLDIFIDQVGFNHEYTYAPGKKVQFKGGENTQGIDMVEDNGKYMVVFQPSL